MFRQGGFHLSDIDIAIAEGKFADAILMAVGSVEFFVDSMVIRSFDLLANDPKSAFLTNRTFGSKIELLKVLGLLEPAEFFVLRKFGEERNLIFHQLLHKKTKIAALQAKEERDKVMSLARDAAHAAAYAYLDPFPRQTGEEWVRVGFAKVRDRHIEAIIEKHQVPKGWKRKPKRSGPSERPNQK